MFNKLKEIKEKRAKLDAEKEYQEFIKRKGIYIKTDKGHVNFSVNDFMEAMNAISKVKNDVNLIYEELGELRNKVKPEDRKLVADILMLTKRREFDNLIKSRIIMKRAYEAFIKFPEDEGYFLFREDCKQAFNDHEVIEAEEKETEASEVKKQCD